MHLLLEQQITVFVAELVFKHSEYHSLPIIALCAFNSCSVWQAEVCGCCLKQQGDAVTEE